MGRPGTSEPSQGFAIHIGLDGVDPKQYGGWDGMSQSAVADANSMQQLSAALGYNAKTIVNKAATATAVLSELARLAESCGSGDIVVMTFSGHGGQVPDFSDERDTGLADTWVLYDRMLIDEELRAAFAGFVPGARIVVVSDCCHSGTDTFAPKADLRPRLMSGEAQTATVTKRGDTYASARFAARYAFVDAATLLLAACQDDQLAWEDEHHGLFTGELLNVWADGKYRGDYRSFVDAISAGIGPQRPNLFQYGAGDLDALASQQPFDIPAPPGQPGGAFTLTLSFEGTVSPPVTVTISNAEFTA